MDRHPLGFPISKPPEEGCGRTLITDECGLSPLQQGMLFHHLSGDAPGVDIEQIVIGYDEPLDVALLERAWRLAVWRHPALRTSFGWKQSSDPMQRVHDHVALSLKIRAGAENEAGFQEFLARDRAYGFDLSQAPLMRLALFEYGQHRYRLVWTVHHILLDGRAFILVLNDVEEFYQRLRDGEPVAAKPGPAFRPYIEWQQSLDLEGADKFWADRLQGLAGPTPLLEDAQALGGAFNGYGEEELRLSEEVTFALREVAKRYDITLNTIVMGVWGLLLSRYSGEQDVLFGATKTSRRGSIAAADAVVGLFLNTVPVRANLPPEAPFVAALQELRAEWRSLRAYEHTQLTRIKEASGFAPSAPLFDSLLAFENQSFQTALSAASARWKVRQWHLFEQTNFPLTFCAFGDPEMLLKLAFDRRRFTHETAQRMLRHARQVFEGIAANPEQKIGELTLLSPAERHRLLYGWNDSKTDYRADACLHELFEEQVARTPEAVAIDCGGKQLTYAELNGRANRLAHYLRKLGVKPDARVAVCVERSLEMVVALMAVVKAGGAYVPLDPAYPTERRHFMLEDSAPLALLTQGHLKRQFSSIGDSLPILDLTAATPAWHNLPESNPERGDIGLSPDHLAYIIYTSGSTGNPKGVMISHRGASNTIQDINKRFRVTEKDKVLALSSFAFDLSVYDVFGQLAIGGKTVIPPPDRSPDASKWQQIIKANKVTVWNSVPALIQLFVDSATQSNAGTFDSIRLVMLSGDWVPARLVEKVQTLFPNARVYSLGGATEVSIWSVYFPVASIDPKWTNIPYGTALGNQTIYVLDKELRPCPVGIRGELYIGGVGVARGYLNRPELTKEKFLSDPFASEPGAQIYRTGDLGRWLADGNVEFLGRNDFQVKIRGFRIELGEIEARLAQHPSVREVAVIAREDTPGDKRLVAYYTALQTGAPKEGNVGAEHFRAHLYSSLPEYMIPAAYVLLEALPLTPNGKLDRKALPAPESNSYFTRIYEPPQGELETKLAALWAEVLKLERVGRHDNFFDLGGDSLLAVQLILRLQEIIPGELLPLRAVLEAPTVEQFADWLNHRGGQQQQFLVQVRPGTAERTPFFCVHGAGGNVLSMRPLAMALSADLPVYFLQAKGLDGSEPFESVEETARCYLDEIRKMQPRGPYQIGGGSYGGLVAFEMARILEQLGEPVATLILIDVRNPAFKRSLPKRELWFRFVRFYIRRVAVHSRRIFSLPPDSWLGYTRGRFKALKVYLRNSVETVAEVEGKEFPADPDWVRVKSAAGTRLGEILERVGRASRIAGKKFEPKPYRGSAVIVRASDNWDTLYEDDFLGWKPLVQGAIEVFEVEGNHDSMFEDQAVRTIATRIDPKLRESSADAELEFPANSVPVGKRQTGMEGASNGDWWKAYFRADPEPAETD